MNLGKIQLVAGREYSIRVKKKSFIFTTILTPILFAALMIVPSVVMLMGGNEEIRKVVVVDNSGVVAPTLVDTEIVDYEVLQGVSVDSLKANFEATGAYAIVEISQLDENKNVSITAYSAKQMNMELKSSIKRSANAALEAYKLESYDIENLDKILEDVKSDVQLSAYTIGDDGDAKKSMVEISMAMSYIMSFFIYIFVFMFGNMVMNSVIQEKSNRIVEVIVSSVKPFDLMLGKILGVAGVAVTQFLIWVVLTVVLVFGFQAVMGPELFTGGAQQMTQMAGVDAEAMMAAAAAPSGPLADIMGALSQINFPYIIGCFLIYFVLGYLLYAAMFAAVGSAVENEADTQQLTLPISLPLILGLFIMLHTFEHPESSLSFWASMIPFTSPMVMLARIPFEGAVPTWELLLSIGLLFVTFLAIVYLSGKIYRVGILMYGKKASWKDLWKWIKY
ncbi:MAG: ABC transporter permease [Bacteroidales bacterium]|nr:ABC transporter permease [Bacteroidales bacterium]MBO7321544.1 ABC transporter permease [Bacteroidales bacterium]